MFKFSVKGLDEMQAAFDKGGSLDQALCNSVRGFIFRVVSHIVERGTANAPILTGDLRANLIGLLDGMPVAGVGMGVAEIGPSPPADRIIGAVVDSMPYALRMHEEFYRLGPISRQQPTTPEGGVGRKYVERVAYFHLERYKAGLNALLQQWLPEGAKGSLKVEFPS